MLNTLLDFRRELYLPDGRTIKADPSVLIVGLQNPQNYAGVNKLSQKLLSRALIMEMDYPQAQEGTRFLPYEAEVYAAYRPALAGLSQREFYALWDKIINRTESQEGARLTSVEREREIKGLHRLVSVAQGARTAYRAYLLEESAEPFDFNFSIREAEAIAALWNGTAPIDRMIARVVLPKISDRIERKAMEALISQPAA